MAGYYDEKLSAKRLRQCYEIAPPRVKQYLKAEVEYALSHILPTDSVLDLGCGYGRLLPYFLEKAKTVIGIDNSFSSLQMALQYKFLKDCPLICADAAMLPITDLSIDKVLCLQNGISAFHVDHMRLIRECVRVVKKDGLLIFSTYAKEFWNHRIEWFELQSKAGLLGEIDYDQTGDGQIVCKDGFTATTLDANMFEKLANQLRVNTEILTVDDSSLFCIIKKK